MDIIEKRRALAEALTAHNAEAIKLILHPSFAVRGADGIVIMDYAGLLKRLPTFFDSHPEYKQSVKIEDSKVDGDLAVLKTSRTELLHMIWWPHSVTSRWIETWKKFDGEWELAEEKPNPD